MLTRRRLLIGAALALVLLAGGFLGTYFAEQRALAAEERYVAERLENSPCLADWGVDEGAVTKSAAVTGPTLGGVRVRVTMPYAHRVETDEGPLFADSGSDDVCGDAVLDATARR